MTQYTVQWSYHSGIGGPWAAGEIVKLSPAHAEALNRDSPGVLIETRLLASGAVMVDAAPDADPIPDARDRMVKRAAHRGQGGKQSPIDRTTFKAVRDKE